MLAWRMVEGAVASAFGGGTAADCAAGVCAAAPIAEVAKIDRPYKAALAKARRGCIGFSSSSRQLRKRSGASPFAFILDPDGASGVKKSA